MNIISIAVLQTNYVWLLYNSKNICILIDPGETKKILKILKKSKLILKAILLTHNHNDHIDGVHILIKHFPKIVIYGPKEIKNKSVNFPVSEGDNFNLLQKKFTVFHLPGHTSGHIGFYSAPWLFCGDTVFSMGCGKFDEKLAKKMYKSFSKISKFPHNTLIFSGHEYTLSNIIFAKSALPQNKSVIKYYHKIVELRKKNQPTTPTMLNLELKINPFFRCNHIDIKKSLNYFPKSGEEWKIFAKLRQKKDSFNFKYIKK